MAYPQYYPQYFPQNYPQITQQAQTPQQNGLVSVRNENEARIYPVAFGASVTFKDETAPYIYTKTMGFSQLDTPRFERYRIVKEEAQENEPTNLPPEDFNERIEAIWGEIDALKKAVFKKKAKEVADDE